MHLIEILSFVTFWGTHRFQGKMKVTRNSCQTHSDSSRCWLQADVELPFPPEEVHQYADVIFSVEGHHFHCHKVTAPGVAEACGGDPWLWE